MLFMLLIFWIIRCNLPSQVMQNCNQLPVCVWDRLCALLCSVFCQCLSFVFVVSLFLCSFCRQVPLGEKKKRFQGAFTPKLFGMVEASRLENWKETA